MSTLASRFVLVLALPLATAGAISAVAQTTVPESPGQTETAPAAPSSDTAPDSAPEAQGRPAFAGKRGEHGHRGRGMEHGPMSAGPRGFGSARMGPQMGMMQLFEEADADGDGALTREELDGFRGEVVSDADASGDGNIDLEEFEAIYLRFTRERMVDLFQELDADGDGWVTTEELDARFGGLVARFDRNDDGQLSIEDRGRR